jgi:hypothetical protein
MATFDSNISAYGIVDDQDPSTAISGSTRNFSVSPSANVPNAVNVKPGTAVFKSGEIIILSNEVTQLALADSTPNVRNIVYLQFDEEELDPVLTRSQTLVNSRVDYLPEDADYIKITTKDAYDSLTSSARAKTIPLALVTVQTIAAQVGTTTRVVVDMSRSSYTKNRPWFSVVDAEHRSGIGTGAITRANVHGLSLNDLSVTNGLTFLQIALDHGMIVAKDKALAGVPGTICEETIPISAVLTDGSGAITGITGAYYFRLSRVPVQILRVAMPIYATGTITVLIGPNDVIVSGDSFILNDGDNPAVTFQFDTGFAVTETDTLRKIAFTGAETTEQMRDLILTAINTAPALEITAAPGAGAGDIDLINDKPGINGNQPILESVGDSEAFVVTGMSGGMLHELAPVYVPGSNLVALLPTDEFDTVGPADLKVYSAVVDAGEPILAAVNPSFKVKAAAETEVMISGGLFLQKLTNTELKFENAGPIPANYTVYADDAGTLQMFPQTIYCYKRLADIGFTLQSFDYQLLGPAPLKVFLADAAAGPLLDVQVEITGQDESGNTVTETVSFDDTWSDNTAPGTEENLDQSVITSTVFASVSNLIVSARNNDGPNTTILVQGLISPTTTTAIADVLPIAEVFWNGFQVASVRDIRPVNTSMTLPDYMAIAAAAPATAEILSTIATYPILQYWAEDFDKPRLVTTEVTHTALVPDGLDPIPTELTKLAKGLGRNDTYISRPIAVKPYSGTARKLRFMPIQPGPGFSLKVRYYRAGVTNAWTPWIDSFSNPGYTVSLSSLTDMVKWQMIVTGPCQGMYVVLTTNDGADSLVFDSGAWPNGVFL